MHKAEVNNQEFLSNCLVEIRKELKKLRKAIERQQPQVKVIYMNKSELGELQAVKDLLDKVNTEYALYRAAADQTKAANDAKIAELNAALETLQNQIGDQADPTEVQTTISGIKSLVNEMDSAVADLNNNGEVDPTIPPVEENLG